MVSQNTICVYIEVSETLIVVVAGKLGGFAPRCKLINADTDMSTARPGEYDSAAYFIE